MKAVLSALVVVGAAGVDSGKDVIGQVIQMCEDLTARVIADGEANQKAYDEYFSWCDDTTKEKQNELVTANSQKGKLEASIDELASEVEVCDSTIADLVEAIAENSKDLGAATKIRASENSVFTSNEAELEDVVATLGKAIGVLEKELASGSASFAQLSTNAKMQNTLQAFQTLIDAASFSLSDKQKIAALIQSHDEAENDDSDASDSSDKKSSGIVEVLGGMKEKAETQLSGLRKAENESKNNFMQLKQSLDSQISNDNMQLDFTKKKKADSEEKKATARGELDVCVKDIKTTEEALALTQKDCMTVAIDHENAIKSRDEELKVIAMAVKIIKEATLVQTSTSFVQTQMQTKMMSVQSKVVKTLRKIGQETHSTDIAMLATRIVAMSRSGQFRTSDPFAKIRGMIQDMITKIEDQMGAEAQEKAYCDEEMSKTEEKKGKLETGLEKLTNKIDKSSARSAELKEQVTVIQGELATLAEEQKEMDKVRADENAAYLKESADLKKGLAGIRKALELLKSYYGSAAAFVQEDMTEDDSQPTPPAGHAKGGGGAGGSIIDILEVAEDDMAKELAKVESQEADEASAYEDTTQENKLTKAAKQQDVKYKSQEAAGLDKSITELSSDRDTVTEELGTVNAYYMKIQERCVAKPVSYEERKKARAKEIEGLKIALDVLENEAALVQTKKGRKLRGALQL